MRTKVVQPSAKLMAFRADALAVIKKHTGDLTALEMLGVCSHLVGQLIALQDQRTVTSAMAMQIVSENIEVGNQEVIAGLLDGKDRVAT